MRLTAGGGLALLLLLSGTAGAAPVRLTNGLVAIEAGERGLRSMADESTRTVWHFRQDEFSIVIDGTEYDSRAIGAPVRRATRDSVTYAWKAGPFGLEVAYELKPGWRFVSKRILVAGEPLAAYTIDEVTVWRAVTEEAIGESYIPSSGRPDLGLGSYGLCLRYDRSAGLLAVAQNPFLAASRQGNAFTIGYRPAMAWKGEYGRFAADRGLLAPYRLSGRRVPAAMTPEWRMLDAGAAPGGEGMDEAEVEAFTGLVRAFLLHRPERPTNIFVAWCVNDYQIDIATEAGRDEYKRVMDRAADLGAEHVLFAPTNSDLGRREESVDDWSWENLLWLGLGQKIRRGEWDPATGTVPASVQEMIDHARSRGLRLVAYVYPVLAFSQNPGWLVTRPNAPDGKRYASLGHRALQDWLIETLVAFHRRTGISGYSFDHAFLTFAGPSRYAQWWGWRRVMETLRERIPDIVIDGRQAYHLYGPWSWLAGSYPHPTFNDEQPESFVPFPDLSFDRVSADRQRYTAYRYRVYDFAPSEIVPGFITHQTGRADDSGGMPQTKTGRGLRLDRFRPRDWDYLGWRYSLLSSIATGGWNNVLDMIPARDLEEFERFSEADRAWFRGWIEWTRTHKELLRTTRAILGQPALGKIDGTSAISGDRGFLFLFNPNARRTAGRVPLDESIGLTAGAEYVVREVYPLEGRLVGKPGAGAWARGDRLPVEMDGHSALVYEIAPAGALAGPVLFNAPGSAVLDRGVLIVEGVRGEAGTSADLLVRLPAGTAVASARVNGIAMPVRWAGPGLLILGVRFDGERFGRAQQVGTVDPAFAGGTFRASMKVPSRVFAQLEARQRAWPIPWTPDDFRAPWLAPERLLLFVQIAEPDEAWEPRLRIGGRTVELRRAYSSIRAVRRTFVGFYADLSLIAPDRDYEVELDLPPLRPGQFLGLFFEHVETEYTGGVTAMGSGLAFQHFARVAPLAGSGRAKCWKARPDPR